MLVEDRDDAHLTTRALTKNTLSCLRDVETTQVALRKGLVKLGCICDCEIIDGAMETEYIIIQTPLAEMIGEHVKGLDNVIIINILCTMAPFVEGLFKASPQARQGVISTGRNEKAEMDDDGGLPITISYVKLPEITEKDIVTVANSMLATGSTMCSVLDRILEDAGVDPERLFVLSAVSVSDNLLRVDNRSLEVDLLTITIDDYLGDDGYTVPGLGDAGDHASRTT